MNTPDTITAVPAQFQFIAVVFNGKGQELVRHHGNNKGEAEGPAMRAFQEYQEAWEQVEPAKRIPDPPMWSTYERTAEKTGAGLTVYRAIWTTATEHHGFETAPGVPAPE